MLNINALNIAQESAQTLGVCTFENLNASPYHMVDSETGNVNAGISFSYEGGKFSCPIDPNVAFELQKAAERSKIKFSRIEISVAPASFGREKRGGIKPLNVTGLWCGKTRIYPTEEQK